MQGMHAHAHAYAYVHAHASMHPGIRARVKRRTRQFTRKGSHADVYAYAFAWIHARAWETWSVCGRLPPSLHCYTLPQLPGRFMTTT